MRYFFDTEFIDAPPMIYPLSIGIIAEDERSYYAEFRHDEYVQHAGIWVRENVLPKLTEAKKTPETIRDELTTFIGREPEQHHRRVESPEFWGWFPAYDWVIFCQLFGAMVDGLPWHWPNRPNDLVQWANHLGIARDALPEEPSGKHHAFADAQWNYHVYQFLADQARRLNDPFK